MAAEMTADTPFDQFVAAAQIPGLRPAAAHGFLSAAEICPGGFAHRPWQAALLGPDIVDEPLEQLARACIADIGTQLRVGNYRLPEAANADPVGWSEGFLDMLGLAEAEWREFNDEHIEAAKPLFAINMLADAPLYGGLSGDPADHRRFVQETAPLLGPMVRKMAAYLLSGPEVLDLLDEDDVTESYPEHELHALSDEALMDTVRGFGDRLPRVAVDECVRRGPVLVPRLHALLRDTDLRAPDLDDGDWWAVLHAIFILGALDGREAAEALLAALQLRRRDPDNHLWEWLAGRWPALFRNKREHVAAALTELAQDRTADPYLRHDAQECLLEAAHAAGAQPLEALLDQLEQRLADPAEDQDLRELTGHLLLDFPRARHRPALEGVALDQERTRQWGRAFDRQDVARSFAAGEDRPPWERFADYLAFYNPHAVHRRQIRWRKEDAGDFDEEDAGFADDDLFGDQEMLPEPYVRPVPKIGRNDPCPCGSGKKYKKCCMDKT
jgi:uncharacterized protein YecA (UPF0149 family)